MRLVRLARVVVALFRFGRRAKENGARVGLHRRLPVEEEPSALEIAPEMEMEMEIEFEFELEDKLTDFTTRKGCRLIRASLMSKAHCTRRPKRKCN